MRGPLGDRLFAAHAKPRRLERCSTSRGASRLVSPPTFERIRDLDADVAIVDRS